MLCFPAGQGGTEDLPKATRTWSPELGWMFFFYNTLKFNFCACRGKRNKKRREAWVPASAPLRELWARNLTSLGFGSVLQDKTEPAVTSQMRNVTALVWYYLVFSPLEEKEGKIIENVFCPSPLLGGHETSLLVLGEQPPGLGGRGILVLGRLRDVPQPHSGLVV